MLLVPPSMAYQPNGLQQLYVWPLLISNLSCCLRNPGKVLRPDGKYANPNLNMQSGVSNAAQISSPMSNQNAKSSASRQKSGCWIWSQHRSERSCERTRRVGLMISTVPCLRTAMLLKGPWSHISRVNRSFHSLLASSTARQLTAAATLSPPNEFCLQSQSSQAACIQKDSLEIAAAVWRTPTYVLHATPWSGPPLRRIELLQRPLSDQFFHTMCWSSWCSVGDLVGGIPTLLKYRYMYISQLGWLFPTEWKKNVPNHQPG